MDDQFKYLRNILKGRRNKCRSSSGRPRKRTNAAKSRIGFDDMLNFIYHDIRCAKSANEKSNRRIVPTSLEDENVREERSMRRPVQAQSSCNSKSNSRHDDGRVGSPPVPLITAGRFVQQSRPSSSEAIESRSGYKEKDSLAMTIRANGAKSCRAFA